SDARVVSSAVHTDRNNPSGVYRFGVVPADGNALLHVELPSVPNVSSNDAPFIEGAFTLQWSPAAQPRAARSSAATAPTTETALREITQELTPVQRAALRKALLERRLKLLRKAPAPSA